MELENNLPFEDRLQFIEAQIDKRRSNWRLTTLEWEDARQIILTRIWMKYDTFKPERGKFEHWLNRSISNARINLLRDHLYKYARPCISAGPSGGACVKNTGEGGCSWTASKKQCGECPLYKDWQKKKESQFNIKDALSIETHYYEVNTMANENIDIDRVKSIIDDEMPNRLNAFEAKVYKMLYVDNMDEIEVGKKLKYKPCKNSETPGYQMIRALKKKFVSVSKDIIRERGF